VSSCRGSRASLDQDILYFRNSDFIEQPECSHKCYGSQRELNGFLIAVAGTLIFSHPMSAVSRQPMSTNHREADNRRIGKRRAMCGVRVGD